MKKIVFAVALATTTLTSITSCHNESGNNLEKEITYYCPMKCEGNKTYITKDVSCPVCGMELMIVN